jgi:hypothetical protein
MNIIKNDFVFHNGETETADGNVLYAPTANQVAIYITGVAASHTIKFEGSDGVDEHANWYAAYAKRADDNTVASETNGVAECWIVDLTPWVAFRARIDAISGANASLTVIGRVVDTNN